MIKTKSGKVEFNNKIKESMQQILNSEVVVFGAGNKEVKNLLGDIQKDWQGVFNGLKSANLKSNGLEHIERNIAKQAMSADSNVNYCYSGYSALNFNNTDSVYLDLAAHLMTNNRMHTALREQGGAYGAGASYNPLSGVFLLSTYRDPGFENTYKEFDSILEWFMKYDFTEEQLNEAKIGVLKNIDKPSIPQVETELNITLHMMGISSELRKERKNKLIDADIKDVKNAVTNYLLGTSPNSCAFISKHSTHEATKLMFDLSEVKEIT
jgi:Zn-dependent M16 (insulinase) family peptidase